MSTQNNGTRPSTDRLRNELIVYIRRKFHNIDGIYTLAEDIVQEAWLKISTPEQENFGYLSKVCVRLAYRLYKKQRGQTEVSLVDLLVGEEDVTAQIIAHERASDVLTSLDTLREVERVIVVLRYYEDCSFAEISRRTGINLNTVLTVHRRALEKLRPRLSRILALEKEPSLRDYLRVPENHAITKRRNRND